MMTILMLAVVVVLVATMRPGGARPPSRTGDARNGKTRAGTAPKRGSVTAGEKVPGVVTYALMEDKKLPTRAQRAYRRLARPFTSASGWMRRRFRPPGAGPPRPDGETAPPGPSAELQNFLEARNREIARRKAEGPTKPGPDDMLH